MNYNALLNRQKGQRYGNRLNKLPCQNNSGSNVIPAFGLVRVVGVNAQGVALVDQPNADGGDVFVNVQLPIPPGAYGTISKSWPLWAAYDSTSGTPAIGDTWGAASGSYLLTKSKPGFAIQQPPAAGNAGRVLIAPGSQLATVTSQGNFMGGYNDTALHYSQNNFGDQTLILTVPGIYCIQFTAQAQINGAANAVNYVVANVHDVTHNIDLWGGPSQPGLIGAPVVCSLNGGTNAIGAVSAGSVFSFQSFPVTLKLWGAMVNPGGSWSTLPGGFNLALPYNTLSAFKID